LVLISTGPGRVDKSNPRRACSLATSATKVVFAGRLSGFVFKNPPRLQPDMDIYISPFCVVSWVRARRVSEIGIGDWIYGFIGDGFRGMCRVGGASVEGFAAGAVPRGAATAAEPRLQRPGPAQAQGTHHEFTTEASPPSFSMPHPTEEYVTYTIPLR